MLMDHKKEIKRQFKESKSVAGVYQIKNIQNQKVFLGSTLNLKTLNGKTFQLEMGSYPNKALQKEWTEFGKEAFVVEVLEELKPKEDDYTAPADALKKLEEKWLDKLQPYGDRGYN